MPSLKMTAVVALVAASSISTAVACDYNMQKNVEAEHRHVASAPSTDQQPATATAPAAATEATTPASVPTQTAESTAGSAAQPRTN